MTTPESARVCVNAFGWVLNSTECYWVWLSVCECNWMQLNVIECPVNVIDYNWLHVNTFEWVWTQLNSLYYWFIQHCLIHTQNMLNYYLCKVSCLRSTWNTLKLPCKCKTLTKNVCCPNRVINKSWNSVQYCTLKASSDTIWTLNMHCT